MAVTKINLSKISPAELLKTRICDLPLNIEGTWLKGCIKTLYQELDSKGIRFRPTYYLADEWLSPDEEPLVGIPFYLAHPSLMKLEKKMMLDVEGGTRSWCMKLLRHETGHAINYAYKLHRRKKWKKIFGRFSKEYTDTYRFRPYSKNFVRHLEDYYAQYHPDEDFAETFAVWLTPALNWEKQYKGWKAMIKLNYVDALMRQIGPKGPLVKKGKKYWEAARTRTTLEKFYKKKRYFHAEGFPDFHDSNLKRIFSLQSEIFPAAKKDADLISAVEIIKRYKNSILKNVAVWTGEKKYIIADLIDTLILRCRQLRLSTDRAEALVLLEISAYVTALVMNYLYTGAFRRKRCAN
ncbi:MAG: hypothetical protein NG737_00770 [Omnitrophica bacterium]|nr:hypothetical protein [Candidatus Omnitrophota bacterium]